MSDETILAPDASVLGRPNSYIGRSIPRPNARRLLSGQGRFVDDLKLQRTDGPENQIIVAPWSKQLRRTLLT